MFNSRMLSNKIKPDKDMIKLRIKGIQRGEQGNVAKQNKNINLQKWLINKQLLQYETRKMFN